MSTLKGGHADPAATLARHDRDIGELQARLAAIRIERANLGREEVEVLERLDELMRAQGEVVERMAES